MAIKPHLSYQMGSRYVLKMQNSQFWEGHKSCIRRRGSFGHQPGNFSVMQLMNYKNILFINLDRIFQLKFCITFHN